MSFWRGHIMGGGKKASQASVNTREAQNPHLRLWQKMVARRWWRLLICNHAMLLVGVLWVLPMLALALLFSEGEGLVETGCRFIPEQGHPEGTTVRTSWEDRGRRNKQNTKETNKGSLTWETCCSGANVQPTRVPWLKENCKRFNSTHHDNMTCIYWPTLCCCFFFTFTCFYFDKPQSSDK